MQNENILTIEFKFTRGKALFLIALFFLCWHPKVLNSETLTLTTYYPAPYGGYVSLLTTGAGNANTLLARDGGRVAIGTFGAAPTAKLDIMGIGGGTVDLKINGRIQTGDGAGQGGMWLSSNNDSFVGDNSGAGSVGFWTSGAGWGGLQVAKANGDVSLANGQVVAKFATGVLQGVCTPRHYGFGGVSSCLANERIMGFYGDGVARLSGWVQFSNPTNQSNVSGGFIVNFGQDWGGTMMCCKM